MTDFFNNPQDSNLEDSPIILEKDYKKTKLIFQKKIIKDENINDFFLKISKFEELIFEQLNQCIESDMSPNAILPLSTMIKACNSILDMKKKQLEIKRITNFLGEKKRKKDKDVN